MIVVAWAVCLFQIIVGIGVWYAATKAAQRLEQAGPFECSLPAPQMVIAATGALPGLERLRDALAAQSVPIARLIFAVEATDDPAFQRIAAVFDGFAVPVTIVTAGLATAGAQKSRNLVEALRGLDDARPLVLADVDIVPAPGWLATMLRPIQARRADIVTGYRWPQPIDARAPTLVIAWIDRAIAALPKRVGNQLIWGGSVALAAGSWTRIGLLDRLEYQVSDDLFLAGLARRHGLRVVFTTGALLATPTRHGWRSMFGFGRRQYQMIRLYAPRAWAAALVVTLVNLIGSALPLVLIFASWWAAIAYAAIVGTSLLASLARGRLGRAAAIPAGPSLGERRLLLLSLILPVVHLVHLSFIVGAVRVTTIAWGRFTYRMNGIRVVSISHTRDRL